MKSNIRKILSLVIILSMVLSIGTVGFAAVNSDNVFISGDDTYTLYMDGDMVYDAPSTGYSVNYTQVHSLYYQNMTNKPFIAVKGEDIGNNIAGFKMVYNNGTSYMGTNNFWYYKILDDTELVNDGKNWYDVDYKSAGWKQATIITSPAGSWATNDEFAAAALNDPQAGQDDFKWIWSPAWDEETDDGNNDFDKIVYFRNDNPSKCVVTFDANGGSPTPLNQVVDYGNTAIIPQEPQKLGYSFDGWYIKNSDVAFDFNHPVESDVDLVAHWIENPTTTANYTVIHVDENNNEIARETKTGTIGENTSAARLDTVEEKGYCFVSADQVEITSNGLAIATVHYKTNIVVLTARSAVVVYDGNLQTVIGWIDNIDNVSFYHWALSAKGEGTDPGIYNVSFDAFRPDVIDGDDGKYYQTIYKDGQLIIRSDEIIVTANSESQEYNGEKLINSGFTYSGTLDSNHQVVAEIEGSQLYAGSSENAVQSVKIVDDNNNDVTAMYVIGNSINGMLTVNPRPISLTSDSSSKYYDGTPLTNPNVRVTSDLGFLTRDEITYKATGIIIDVGSTKNTIVVEGEGLSNYAITKQEGTLTVNPNESNNDPVVTIEPEETPLGKLNYDDHFAYVEGYPDKSVRPNGNITRAEVSAIFFRLLEAKYKEEVRSNINSFSDVMSKSWYNKHVSTLFKGKIINGYQDGTFRPNQQITRAELAVIASRFDQLELDAVNPFSDVKGHWAEKYIASAAKKGWVSGYRNGTFRPDQPITRAEFMTLVNNVLNRHVTTNNILPGTIQFTDLQNKDVWFYNAVKIATNSYLYENVKDEPGYQKWTKLIKPVIEM